MRELQNKVIEWATIKGLLTDVTPERIEKQTLKVLEELGETAGAYLKGNRLELIDGIGDIAVTIIILAAMRAHKLEPVNTAREYSNRLIDVTACLLLSSDYLSYLGGAMYQLNEFAVSQGLELEDCLRSAYDVISKRTGKMQNGTFIKD